MSKSILLLLLLIDITVPILACIILSTIFQSTALFEFMLFGLISGILFFIFQLINSDYDNFYLSHLNQKLRLTAISWIKVSFIMSLYLLIFVDVDFIDIRVLLIWFVLIPFMVLFLKYLVKPYLSKLSNFKLVIVGDYYQFSDSEIKRLTDKGYIVDFRKDISDKLESYDIHSSLFVINHEYQDSILNLTTIKHDIHAVDIDKFLELYLRKLSIHSNNENSLFDIRKYSTKNYIIKRIIDFVAFFLLFPILIIVCITTYLAMIKQSPGKLIFHQSRVGYKRKKFVLKKIRTMYYDSEHSLYTKDDDERVYSFAKILRRMRLDELPQLYNVLVGDMHLSGPRPEWDLLDQDYNSSIKYYNLRSLVRPGITGWAQVMFRYGLDTDDASEKLMYDLYYIKNWTVWLEIEIIIRTIIIILYKKGI